MKLETANDIGTRAAQSTPTADQAGLLYFVTDEDVLERWSGSGWVQIGINGGLTTDTSFPGAPSTGDRLRRSDLDYLIFFYDGTRWVTEQMFTLPLTIADVAPHNTVNNGGFLRGGGPIGWDIWAMRWVGMVYVNSTNNASHYVTFSLRKATPLNSYSTVTTYVTSGDSPSQPIVVDEDLSVVIDFSTPTYALLDVLATATGSPGFVRVSTHVRYRRIAT